MEQFVAPRVYEQVDRAAAYHTVGKKETLASIAGRYGVSVASLKAWNGAKSGKRGQKLVVRPASTQTLLTTESGERTIVNNLVKTTYKPAATVDIVEVKSKAVKMNSPKSTVVSKNANKSKSPKANAASPKKSDKSAAKTPVKGESKKATTTKNSDSKKKT